MKKILLILILPMFVILSTNTKNSNKYMADSSKQIGTKKINIDYKKVYNDLQKKVKALDSSDKKEWFIGYKEIVSEFCNFFDTPESIYDYYSDYEIKLICRTVETECYQADFDSKCNVASVILNRIKQEETFGDTIEDVITKRNQFAYGRVNISEDTILAVEYAFMIGDTTNGCIAFHSNSKSETFNGWSYVFTDKVGHHFYR